MVLTYTTSKTTSFTLTHARELASRVIADLRMCSRHYDSPKAGSLDAYQDELVQLLHKGYLETYEFGFKKNDKRVISWYYTVSASGDVEGGSPGGVHARAKIEGAIFFNFVTYSSKWWELSAEKKSKFKEGLDIERGNGSAPMDGDGYWDSNDRGYAAGGTLLTRGTFKSY